jgi:hypothetical protein
MVEIMGFIGILEPLSSSEWIDAFLRLQAS